MKKLSVITILLTVLMSMVATNTFAYDFAKPNADGVTINYVWTNNHSELSVSGLYNVKYSGNVVIPSSVDCNGTTISVTSIGSYAFSGCTSMNSVTIPNSVTSIGVSAFSGCTSLNSVTIPNSVSSIGRYVFANCTSLSSITIPNNVTSIGYRAFYSCSGLTSIIIPNNVTSIGHRAFYECTNLTSITIGDKVTGIGENAFAHCQNLSDVYCLAEKVPSTNPAAFTDYYQKYATLHVPTSAINTYKSTAPWSGFGTFETLSGDAPVMPKCVTPTISFENGKIKFSCETEGAEFVSNISTTDTKDYYDSELTPSFKYKVTVYAIKTGYENSDIATTELEIPSGLKGDLNNDNKVNVADHVELSKIIMSQDNIVGE